MKNIFERSSSSNEKSFSSILFFCLFIYIAIRRWMMSVSWTRSMVGRLFFRIAAVEVGDTVSILSDSDVFMDKLCHREDLVPVCGENIR